jgi:hypothetical protein
MNPDHLFMESGQHLLVVRVSERVLRVDWPIHGSECRIYQ